MSLCGAVRLDRESRTAGESAIQATAAGLLAHPVSLRQTFLCQDSKLSTDRGVVQIELMLCSGFHRDVPWRSRHEEQTGRPYPEHPPTPHRAHSTELTAPPLATPLHLICTIIYTHTTLAALTMPSDNPPTYETAVSTAPAVSVTDPSGAAIPPNTTNGVGAGAGLNRAVSYASTSGSDGLGVDINDDDARSMDDERRSLPKGWVRCFDPK